MIAPEDRDRIEDQARRPAASLGRRSIVGRIVDGGSMPDPDDDGEVVYLFERVDVEFREEADSDVSIDAASGRFAAVRIGGRGKAAPKAGDVFTCHAIGDRWGFTVGASPRKGIRLWIIAKEIIDGFPPGGPSLYWRADEFDPTADGGRWDVFAFWRFDVDTGAGYLTKDMAPFTPDSIPEKQHIFHGRSDDATPDGLEYPWGYIEMPIDRSGVHANNLRSGAGSPPAVVVVIRDTAGDPDYDLVAAYPVDYPRGSFPPYKYEDTLAYAIFTMSSLEFTASDQLTWVCPGMRPRPQPPGTPSTPGTHSFAPAAVTVNTRNQLDLPNLLPSGTPSGTGWIYKVVDRTTAPGPPNGYWRWIAPGYSSGTFNGTAQVIGKYTAQDDINWFISQQSQAEGPGVGIPDGTLSGTQWSRIYYEIIADGYIPSYYKTPIPAPNPVVPYPPQVSFCKLSYGYVSAPRNTTGPFTQPGCVPPVVRVKIEATGVRADAQPPPVGYTHSIPDTVDLKRYFGDYAGATTPCPVRGSAVSPISIFGIWGSDPAPNKSLGNGRMWSQLNVQDNGFLIQSGSASGDVYTFPGDPAITGTGGFPVGGSAFTPIYPPCAGGRPTGGKIVFSYIYGNLGFTLLSASYVIGSWEID